MSPTQTRTLLDCVVTGSGPPVVLIHGTGADAESNCGPLIESLSDRFTVVAPNLPGAGTTPVPTDRLELEQLTDDVIATVQDALDDRITAQIDLDGRIDLASAVTGIQAVTLVLASADDRIIPPLHLALTKGIPNARYRELAGGHGLPFEDPARFFLAITEWLDEQLAKREAA